MYRIEKQANVLSKNIGQDAKIGSWFKDISDLLVEVRQELPEV
jgi:hypothetical protein